MQSFIFPFTIQNWDSLHSLARHQFNMLFMCNYVQPHSISFALFLFCKMYISSWPKKENNACNCTHTHTYIQYMNKMNEQKQIHWMYFLQKLFLFSRMKNSTNERFLEICWNPTNHRSYWGNPFFHVLFSQLTSIQAFILLPPIRKQYTKKW